MDSGGNGRWSKVDVDAPISQADELPENKISEFRTVLPQILASSAKNLLLLDLGMTIAYPTIAIPKLLNSVDEIRFTPEEASWFGSIPYICQPLGSIISGFLFEPLGRKKAMLLVNVPHIFGWLLIYFAKSVTHLYLAAFILGSGIGFMEAPIITYVGEISQPKWRGILAAYAGICASVGFLFVYFLGAATTWRTAAAICSFVPILAIIAILQVPESPVWLLSKGRIKEAERSLRWLRGWVGSNAVQEEFSYLVEHSETHKTKEIISIRTISSEIERQNNADIREDSSGCCCSPARKIVNYLKLNYLFQRATMQPFILVTIFFFVQHASGITSTRPFMVEIFKEFGTTLDENWVTVISSAIGILGNVIGVAYLRVAGKRRISFISSVICLLCDVLICIYGFFFYSTNISSIPIGLFILLNFAWNFGIGQIPWMLISEIFPFEGRGIASGLAAAGSYGMGFVFTKTYYNLYQSLSLPGTFGLFGMLTFLGLIFLYYFLPETEGKTLKEIEVLLTYTFDKYRFQRRSRGTDQRM